MLLIRKDFSSGKMEMEVCSAKKEIIADLFFSMLRVLLLMKAFSLLHYRFAIR
jgi:hypothetical protein